MDSHELLAYAADQLQRLGVPYLITGSMATITYGEARFTNDVDIVADFELTHVDALLAAFPDPDYYCSRAAVEEAIRRRSQFNVIHPTSGLKIDFMIPADDEFNRSRLRRGRDIVVDDAGHQARFASPEDTILKKLQYYREGGSEKHVRDIKGVLMIQGDAIDFGYLEAWAESLGVIDLLRRIQKEVSS
ncbi:MAG: hypothetical protein IIA67_08040 [Planctomycetes bacterium]|nr:hypothetical protein [Planctomycetota bacterium]